MVVSVQTQEQAVDWWSVLLQTPTDTHTPIIGVGNTADYKRALHPTRLLVVSLVKQADSLLNKK